MQIIPINDILNTYESLSDEKRAKIARIALRQIEERGVSGFNEQYSYLASLVDSFQEPYSERFASRLDAPLRTGEDDRSLIDIIVPQQERGIEEEIDSKKLIRDTSEPDIKLFDERDVVLISKLLERTAGRSGAALEELFDEFRLSMEENIFSQEERTSKYQNIRERLSVLFGLAKKDKRFNHRERKIVYINLDSENPWLQWGRRDYKGMPLDFFRRNIDVYGRFVTEGRSALLDFDHGLYAALLRYKIKVNEEELRQMDLAIPKRKVTKISEAKTEREKIRELQDQEIEKIDRKYQRKDEIIKRRAISVYEISGGDLSKANAILGMSPFRIYGYWREAGLEIKKEFNEYERILDWRRERQLLAVTPLPGTKEIYRMISELRQCDFTDVNELESKVLDHSRIPRELLLGQSQKPELVSLRMGLYLLYQEKFGFNHFQIARLTRRPHPYFVYRQIAIMRHLLKSYQKNQNILVQTA